MISTYLLLEDIKNELKAAFTGMRFHEPVNMDAPVAETAEPKLREPRIMIQQLMPKRFGTLPDGEEQGEDVPFVVVKCLKAGLSGDSPREWTVNIGIIYGLYTPEHDSQACAQDALNAGERIVMALAKRLYWADNHYALKPGIDLVLGEGKPE